MKSDFGGKKSLFPLQGLDPLSWTVHVERRASQISLSDYQYFIKQHTPSNPYGILQNNHCNKIKVFPGFKEIKSPRKHYLDFK